MPTRLQQPPQTTPSNIKSTPSSVSATTAAPDNHQAAPKDHANKKTKPDAVPVHPRCLATSPCAGDGWSRLVLGNSVSNPLANSVPRMAVACRRPSSKLDGLGDRCRRRRRDRVRHPRRARQRRVPHVNAMPRTIQQILDHADELAKTFEDSDRPMGLSAPSQSFYCGERHLLALGRNARSSKQSRLRVSTARHLCSGRAAALRLRRRVGLRGW